MEAKTGLLIAGAFVIGLGIGGGVGYLVTRKALEENMQEEIDEFKDAYKKRLEERRAKNESKKTDEGGKKTEKEEEVVRNDKPSIMEMSSIVNGFSDNSSGRTNYHNNGANGSLKENLKKLKEEKVVEKEQTIIDYNTFIQLSEQNYTEFDYNYDVDSETWRDWTSDVQYDSQDLPFDTDIIEWNDDDQCYICDKGNHSLYVLEKV